MVSARRANTRDWFDLYYLMTQRGYTMRDFVRTFERASGAVQATIAIRRLCSGQPGIADEGFAALTGCAPTLTEMTDFFVRERDRLETGLAKETREAQPGSGSVIDALWPGPPDEGRGEGIKPS